MEHKTCTCEKPKKGEDCRGELCVFTYKDCHNCGLPLLTEVEKEEKLRPLKSLPDTHPSRSSLPDTHPNPKENPTKGKCDCLSHHGALDGCLCKCHTNSLKEGLAGEIWREVKHELEKSGVKFPQNFNGIGAAYGAWTIIGNGLAKSLQEQKERIVTNLDQKLAEMEGRRNKMSDYYQAIGEIVEFVQTIKNLK